MKLKQDLIDFIEARGGVYSMKGWMLVVKTRKRLATYFNSLADGAVQDAKTMDQLQAQLDHLVLLHSNTLRDILAQGIREAYDLAGGMSVFNEAAEDDRVAKADLDRLPSFEVLQYALTQSADLVTGINETTRELLRNIIKRGLEEQLGVDGTASEIRKALKNMAGYRARSIATTEINSAMSEATLNKIKRVGLPLKRWVARANCCPICARNKAAGAIPVDEAFPSGHQRPPAHPGKCRCAIVGVQGEE